MEMLADHLFAVTDSTLVEITYDGARTVASGNRGMLAFALLSAVLGPGVSLAAVDSIKARMVDGYTVTGADFAIEAIE